MSIVTLSNVSATFPIYNSKTKSLRHHFFNIAVGGKINNQGSNVLVTALSKINLNLCEGDRIGIIGHNGAGKSTLLRLLSGAFYPSEGNINIQGRVNSLIDISLGIDPELSGLNNIYLRLLILGENYSKIKKNIDEITEFSDLGDFINLPVRTYSTGMLMRLLFSISMVLSAEIIIMDEWLSVGDSQFKGKVELKLNEMINNCKVFVIASHSEDLIKKLCNKVLWLEHGEIKMFDSIDRVLKNYNENK